VSESMIETSYLRWLASETPTTWWHDSADAEELRYALGHGATGATTNPVLVYRALQRDYQRAASMEGALWKDATSQERAEALTRALVCDAARMLAPQHESTDGRLGYVCAQVNPARASDAEAMIGMARRFHGWAPNIAVKLPVTMAGLDALEECAAEGITVTATISFTVSQVIAIAQRYRRGLARAREAGKTPGQCFAVLMVGRLDDYLQDVARDLKINVGDTCISQAGLAVAKRAYAIFKERDYEAVLIVAALRGTYHVTELAGAELILSIHPKIQVKLLEPGAPREERIDAPVSPEVIERLCAVREFVRAYEPDGLAPEEFITYGATQRTLTQFSESGWMRIESFGLSP